MDSYSLLMILCCRSQFLIPLIVVILELLLAVDGRSLLMIADPDTQATKAADCFSCRAMVQYVA